MRDLQCAITFDEAFGFTFNPQATDATATMMCIGEDPYAEMMTRERFAALSPRQIADLGQWSFHDPDRHARGGWMAPGAAGGG